MKFYNDDSDGDFVDVDAIVQKMDYESDEEDLEPLTNNFYDRNSSERSKNNT